MAARTLLPPARSWGHEFLESYGRPDPTLARPVGGVGGWVGRWAAVVVVVVAVVVGGVGGHNYHSPSERAKGERQKRRQR